MIHDDKTQTKNFIEALKEISSISAKLGFIQKSIEDRRADIKELFKEIDEVKADLSRSANELRSFIDKKFDGSISKISDLERKIAALETEASKNKGQKSVVNWIFTVGIAVVVAVLEIIRRV